MTAHFRIDKRGHIVMKCVICKRWKRVCCTDPFRHLASPRCRACCKGPHTI